MMTHQPSQTDQEMLDLMPHPTFKQYEVINWEKIAYQKGFEEVKPSKISIDKPILPESKRLSNPYRYSSNEQKLSNVDINAVFNEMTGNIQKSINNSITQTDDSLPEIQLSNDALYKALKVDFEQA